MFIRLPAIIPVGVDIDTMYVTTDSTGIIDAGDDVEILGDTGAEQLNHYDYDNYNVDGDLPCWPCYCDSSRAPTPTKPKLKGKRSTPNNDDAVQTKAYHVK